jgi:transposase
VRLPSYSPELNAIEKLWQFMRKNILSHRLFASLDHIIDVCCDAWNRILAEPGRIRSTCGYRWLYKSKLNGFGMTSSRSREPRPA